MARTTRTERQNLARRAIEAVENDPEVELMTLAEERAAALRLFLTKLWRPSGEQVALVGRIAEEATFRLAHAFPPDSRPG